MGFTKLDSGILDSSIWSEPLATRVVWIAFLAKANYLGFVAASRTGMTRISNVTEEEFDRAVATLEAPDPDSRSPEFEGRRVQKAEGGWQILNYEKYRRFSYSTSDDAKRRHREGYVYFASAGDRIKIGFSINPWARLSELKIANPEIELIGVYAGSMEDEAADHERFSSIRISREWFTRTKELESYINQRLNRDVPDSEKSSEKPRPPKKKESFTKPDPAVLEEIMRLWNDFAKKHNLAQILEIKPRSTREAHLRARMREPGFDFPALLASVEAQLFLLGENEQGWTVDFDWLLAPSNYVKVRERKYLRRQLNPVEAWSKK